MNLQFIILVAIAILFLSCHNKQEQVQLQGDVHGKVIGKKIDTMPPGNIDDPEDITEPSQDIMLRDSVKLYYSKKEFTLPKGNSGNVEFTPATNPQQLLSHSLLVKNRVKKVALYRQALTLMHYHAVRRIDTLNNFSNADLLSFLTLAFNADISQNPLEKEKPELDSIIAELEHKLRKTTKYADILQSLTDFFRYEYMNYAFSLLADNILEFDYNAGGMAGSAEKVYFRKVDGSFKKIKLDQISDSISAIMEKTLKQMAYVDIGRFPMIVEWDNNKSLYSVQFYIQSADAASCCPRYITRFNTKDFNSIIPGSLQYATTEHISDPKVKAVWKNL